MYSIPNKLVVKIYNMAAPCPAVATLARDCLEYLYQNLLDRMPKKQQKSLQINI